MPAFVHEWVEQTLGSRVSEAADQSGGFSPGCATRVRCADGTRAFVKAVGAELNPDTPTLFRREILALTLLGSHPLWADLRASYDSGPEGGDWVVLLLEDVEGTHPDLSDDATMTRLTDATDELVRVMQQRVPDPPREPHPTEGGLTWMSRVFESWIAGLAHADEVPGDLMPGWVVQRVAELTAGVQRLVAQPQDHLVHWDIRDDNLLIRPNGDIVFLDWGAAGHGQDWLDPLLARLERVHLPWFDASLTTSPALVRAGDDAVTSWLVGIGAFLGWRAHVAVDVNLPTLNAFRRRESARFLGAAARRLDLPHDLGGRGGRC